MRAPSPPCCLDAMPRPLALTLLLGLLPACSSPSAPGGPSKATRTAPPQAPRVVVKETLLLDRLTQGFPQEVPKQSPYLVATLHTSLGPISCQLFAQRAPRTVSNFVGLATGNLPWRDPESEEMQQGRPFYDGLTFHRVLPNFLIQTGSPTGELDGGPGYRVEDEIDPELGHERPGTLSMANAGPNTAGSQFFILDAPAPHLDGKHSVFGWCEPQGTIHSIAMAPADPGNRPIDPVVLEKITWRWATRPLEPVSP